MPQFGIVNNYDLKQPNNNYKNNDNVNNHNNINDNNTSCNNKGLKI